MGINEGIEDTHYYNPMLKASLKILGNQVVEKMASPWKNCGVSPDRGETVIKERAFTVV